MFGKSLTYVDRLDAEHVLVALHQPGAGAVDQTLPHLTLTQGQDSTLLPHVHALLLHSIQDITGQGQDSPLLPHVHALLLHSTGHITGHSHVGIIRSMIKLRLR